MGCYGKLYSRRFLGIFELELQWISCRSLRGERTPTASMCQSGGVEHHLREASVSEVITIGLDIAKYVFHVHGADERGRVIFADLQTKAAQDSTNAQFYVDKLH